VGGGIYFDPAARRPACDIPTNPDARWDKLRDWIAANGYGTARRASQYDYLRRIAEKLSALDKTLRADGKAIKAIGVVGTDIFDKLLVLRALRPEFPDALFFTTDLDAELSMPTERDWTAMSLSRRVSALNSIRTFRKRSHRFGTIMKPPFSLRR
jgi:hypothetical protein